MNQWLKDNASRLTASVFVIGLLATLTAIPWGWSAWQRVALYILGIGYVIDYFVGQRWRNRPNKPMVWLAVAMFAMFLLAPIWQLFDSATPTSYFWHQWHRYDWFAYIGIVGIAGCYNRIPLRYVAITMLLTVWAMAGYCAYLYFYTTELDFLVSHLMRLNMLRTQHINSHMVIDLYTNFALIMGFCTLADKSVRPLVKGVIGFLMLPAASFVLLSEGRIGQFTAIAVLLVCLLAVIYRWRKWLCIPFCVLGLISGGWLMMQNERMMLLQTESDPRAVIWQFSWEQIKQKPILGYGLSTLSQTYVERAYNDPQMYAGFVQPILENIPDFAAQGKTMITCHPHNAFLMHWLAYGIMGVIVLIGFLVAAAFLPIGKRRLYLWLMLACFVLQCMTEPIGDHVLPQLICLMLLVWQFSTPADTRP